MNGQCLLAVLFRTPAPRVSGSACLLGVWHVRSDISCVKHGAWEGGMALEGQGVCWDWLWAVLG